jgi:3-oxoacyl-[acyl-carrier protein] reductase
MMVSYPSLENKRILVTGSYSGIGKQIILDLAAQGTHCIIHGRPSEKNFSLKDDLMNSCYKLGAKSVEFWDVDQSLLPSLEEFLTKKKDWLQNHPIHGAVFNAASNRDQLLIKEKLSDMTTLMDNNLLGTMLLTQHLLKANLRNSHTSFVFMSSVVGVHGNNTQSVYSASKAGLIGFAKSLAQEYGRRNIRTNVICPGFIETPMTEKLPSEIKEKYLQKIPLGRMGTPEEISALSLFLLSESSSYITGSLFKIDGGLFT